MSDLPKLTTELEAVNRMLASIGERPINQAVLGTQRLDVERALITLNEAHVLTLTRGWWFNEEEEIELTPNEDGELTVGADVIGVDAHYKYITKFVKRGRRLYNRDTRSYTDNTENLLVDWKVLVPFDDCPESYKIYVAALAGMMFQKRSVGSTTLFEFTLQDTQLAHGILLQEEADQDDSNLRQAPDQFDLNYAR